MDGVTREADGMRHEPAECPPISVDVRAFTRVKLLATSGGRGSTQAGTETSSD